ncbi:MAG TPA: DUF302 domain-containing protein [Stellaceae bacterium]|nr:DUF302 domain-containing protein [Stellaceae bacterium]
MVARLVTFGSAVFLAAMLILSLVRGTRAEDMGQPAADSGIVTGKSGYPLGETIARLKQDIASKGITFFSEIDESQLAAKAGIQARPTTLLVFGNPPLGTQFITSNQLAGLDWPVRLLVFEDERGQVWTAYTDFDYIARRHHITDRKAAFAMASKVIASIVSSVAAK